MLLSFGSYKPGLSSFNDAVTWTPKKLTWDDFQAKPDSQSGYTAVSSTWIEFTSKTFKDSIVLMVPCFFRKAKSWTKNTENLNLLKHEQLHFDIAELIVRKIRKESSSHISKSIAESSAFFNAIYRKYYKMWGSLGKSYDEETNHSINETKQREWDSKIARELSALEEYANPQVVVKRIRKPGKSS